MLGLAAVDAMQRGSDGEVFLSGKQNTVEENTKSEFYNNTTSNCSEVITSQQSCDDESSFNSTYDCNDNAVNVMKNNVQCDGFTMTDLCHDYNLNINASGSIHSYNCDNNNNNNNNNNIGEETNSSKVSCSVANISGLEATAKIERICGKNNKKRQQKRCWLRRRCQCQDYTRMLGKRRVAECRIRPPSALYMNPNVRCIGGDGLPYQRTLRDLLLFREATQQEEDTPCLGPVAAPELLSSSSCLPQLILDYDGAEQSVTDEDKKGLASVDIYGVAKGKSPRIEFTLDGVATPKTFAVIKMQEDILGVNNFSASLPATVGNNFNGSYVCHQLKTQLLPPRGLQLKELPHQFLLRSYVNGSFVFYQSKDAKQCFFDLCMSIAAQALSILETEHLFPRLVAPTFVFGDIHGNFEDLAFFMRNILTFHDLQLTPANILCLGDYVDRGPHSLECLILLLSLKISYPQKVILLRGNHEDRVVCGDLITYGPSCFLAQCESLYGIVGGHQLFKKLTAIFCHFPLAAELIIPAAPNNSGGGRFSAERTVNSTAPTRQRMSENRWKTHRERILCTHGGIPRFFAPPKEDDSLAFLRRDDFPRMLTLFPHNPAVKNDLEVQMNASGYKVQTDGSTVRLMSEEILRKAWFIAFDLMWSDPSSVDLGDDDDDDENSGSNSNSNNNNNGADGKNVSAVNMSGTNTDNCNNNNNNNNNNNTGSSRSGSNSNCSIKNTAINKWGFGVNKRGGNVLTFSAKAVKIFLEAHQYSMLFRAHQEKAHGLCLSKSSRVLTIFSSSNYLGHRNGAGCVLVSSDGEIQLMEKTSS